MKKVNKDPFSNGTEFMMFDDACCSKCIKASQMRENGTYTNADEYNLPNKCSIQRDIMVRMICDNLINERTVQICHDFIMKGTICPYRKTMRKKHAKTVKNQLRIEL